MSGHDLRRRLSRRRSMSGRDPGAPRAAEPLPLERWSPRLYRRRDFRGRSRDDPRGRPLGTARHVAELVCPLRPAQFAPLAHLPGAAERLRRFLDRAGGRVAVRGVPHGLAPAGSGDGSFTLQPPVRCGSRLGGSCAAGKPQRLASTSTARLRSRPCCQDARHSRGLSRDGRRRHRPPWPRQLAARPAGGS